MALLARAKTFSGRGKTKYLTIPSAIAQDSTFPFLSMSDAVIFLIPQKGLLIIPAGEEVVIDEKTDECIKIYPRGREPKLD